MWGVSQHVSAFAEGVENKGKIHLLEITHATMHELGAATGSFLSEIGTLDEQGSVSSRGSLYRGTQAGGSAANDQYIPWLRCGAELSEDFLPCDHGFPFFQDGQSGRARLAGLCSPE
jgi:hypothetical protein